MNTPWVIWLLVIIVSFAVLETYAFKHPDRENTLSHFVSETGAKWPLSIWLFGVLCGILAAHFFWPWAANPLGAGGG